jgi:hypothetical protein
MKTWTMVSGTFLISIITTAFSEETVEIQRCINFMSSYAGSWLAAAEMFKGTKTVDKVQRFHFIFIGAHQSCSCDRQRWSLQPEISII